MWRCNFLCVCSTLPWTFEAHFCHSLGRAAGDAPNNLKLWDIRSKRIPLHNLGGHTDKVLAVAWPTESLIAAGGADGQLRMHTWDSADRSAMAE
jgi:WD40 repeat protein